jgi:hypothetical protein
MVDEATQNAAKHTISDSPFVRHRSPRSLGMVSLDPFDDGKCGLFRTNGKSKVPNSARILPLSRDAGRRRRQPGT